MSQGWSIFVIVLIVINLAGCGWLIWWTMHMRTDDQVEGDESTGHVWDVDLKENNNPLPKWWLNTFYLTLIFTVIYLVLYPGFGNFTGTLGWTQEGQYVEEVAASDAKFGAVYAAFGDASIEDLANNPDAVRIGKNTYDNFCAACHGADARGAISYPNLTDNDWLYGGSGAAVLQTIRNGRNGIMAPFGAVTGADGANEIADWLLADNPDDPSAAAGKARFMSSGCIGCHGINGEGNQALGAPNLTDDIWLHGGTKERIAAIIMNGINNQMPAQLDVIGEDRARLAAAYVLSLSKGTD
ncbi:MAG: cytochrome-c oxidase, cbb3-type subunit III [Gammaproteobacteria bacterium]|nr:cytochrome-c oxidase, cbb3-type subunit III [Gammaproteobacteria bacterium]NND54207.1 cytochrome-c oxidase, cbb3-type subunit III [Gammaproteobacteria bacterium]